MAYQATWNGQVLATAPSKDTIEIEGNIYFPPDAVKRDFLKVSDQHTTCPWKGEASYYDVVVGEQRNDGAAWYYPQPKAGSVERVGQDFASYVAFWQGVEVSQTE